MFSLGNGASEDFVEEANDGLVDLGDEGDLDRELADKTDERRGFPPVYLWIHNS